MLKRTSILDEDWGAYAESDKQILALIGKFITDVELIEKLNKHSMKCNNFEYQMHHTAPHFLGEPLRKILNDLFFTTFNTAFFRH